MLLIGVVVLFLYRRFKLSRESTPPSLNVLHRGTLGAEALPVAFHCVPVGNISRLRPGGHEWTWECGPPSSLRSLSRQAAALPLTPDLC